MNSKLSADEWFLAKQLKHIKKSTHLPFTISVNVTTFTNEYLKQNKKPPYTALIIKAASTLIKNSPEFNQAIFHSICGIKKINPHYNSVNVPIELRIGEKHIVTATNILDAHAKSLKEIQEELKLFRQKKLDDLPVNQIIHSKSPTLIKKLKLNFLFNLLIFFPHFYLKKHGGGISVSSLLNQNDYAHDITTHAYGITTLTLCAASVLKNENQYTLKIGVGFDHTITHGSRGTYAMHELIKYLEILQNDHSD